MDPHLLLWYLRRSPWLPRLSLRQMISKPFCSICMWVLWSLSVSMYIARACFGSWWFNFDEGSGRMRGGFPPPTATVARIARKRCPPPPQQVSCIGYVVCLGCSLPPPLQALGPVATPSTVPNRMFALSVINTFLIALRLHWCPYLSLNVYVETADSLEWYAYIITCTVLRKWIFAYFPKSSLGIFWS